MGRPPPAITMGGPETGTSRGGWPSRSQRTLKPAPSPATCAHVITVPGATKNPAPVIGPPRIRTVQARSRSSSRSAITALIGGLVPRPFQRHGEGRLTLAADPQGGQLPGLDGEAQLELDGGLGGFGRLQPVH